MMLTLARDPDPGVRRSALSALAASGAPQEMEGLAAAAHDPDPETRRAAID